MNRITRRTLFAGWLACLAAPAAVNRIHIVERSDVLQRPYERIIAKAYFAVDPSLAANRIISDIDLARRSGSGLVEFSADLYVLKPRDSAQGNGTVLFEVSNRGGKGMLSMFNLAVSDPDPRQPAHFGDGFLLEQGYTLVWLGWQFDVPREPSRMRLSVPVATRNGQRITGPVRAEWVLDKPATVQSLADRNHIPYPVLDPSDSALQLTVRDHAESTRRVVPRSDWSFTEDRTAVRYAKGFEPGKLYEIVYRAQDPALAGLGPAAIRDLISFLKYGGVETLLGDQRRYIKRAVGFGTSQSGRFLRTFLYYGFNADERGRRVFDGVWPHVAGAGRGSFNHRFAQASRDGHSLLNTLYPTDIFPFSDLDQTDPETGLSGGILTRALKDNVAPKIFYTNSSYEYWGRAASLIHTTLDGSRDAAPARDTRIYLIAGTQHGPGGFPPRQGASQHLPNTNDYRYAMRGLLAAFQAWLKDGTEPPPSSYPRIDGGQLAAPPSLSFPKVPGVEKPSRWHRAWRADYGPEFRAAGVVTIEPPRLGSPFPILVPQVNEDGNEIAGIRLPDVAVPLASYTGWNLRSPAIGAPDELYSMTGSFFPFARTRAERLKSGDSRRSVEERYRDRADYLARVRTAAEDLAARGYVLERDIPRMVERAAEKWDWVAGAR